jgi:hypothetical protein
MSTGPRRIEPAVTNRPGGADVPTGREAQ